MATELLATVDSALAADDFVTAIRACEDLETGMAGDDVTTTITYMQQLFLYIIVDDLENARHLWRRIPESLKTANPELEACWTVGKCIWQNTNVPGAFVALQAGWSAPVSSIAAKAAATIRTRQLDLLSKAYTKISLVSGALALGLDEAEALRVFNKAGWMHQPETGLLDVVAPPPMPQRFDGLDQLAYLTDQVTFLETRSVTKA
mmetsp:Transcript_33603/g.68699  ORF Transcript_33603/g.68699 Transcript_33603/m.68699 type:complete len:205 (-) Transcript_33603:192-806(-)